MKTENGKKKIIYALTVALGVLMILIWAAMAFLHLNTVSNRKYVSDGVRFVAHRGYSAKYFDNTVYAFNAAAAESFFYAIETDVWSTSDGVFVCSHTETPFADKSIKITEHTYDEIKNLPLDTSGAQPTADVTLTYTIATLSDFLTACSVSQKYAFVEIKQKLSREETELLASAVYSKLASYNVTFCGFNYEVLGYIEDAYYRPILQTFTAKRILAFFYTQMGYNIIVNKNILTNDKIIKRAHKAGLYVGAYTVTEAEEAKRLIAMGIDYIVCNGVLEGL